MVPTKTTVLAMSGKTMQQCLTLPWTTVMMKCCWTGNSTQVQNMQNFNGKPTENTVKPAPWRCWRHPTLCTRWACSRSKQFRNFAGGRKFQFLGQDVTWLAKACPWCPCWVPPEWWVTYTLRELACRCYPPPAGCCHDLGKVCYRAQGHFRLAHERPGCAVLVIPTDCAWDCPRRMSSILCRWYKYGRRQKRIFLGYTAFAGLGLLFLALIVGFIVYGLHSGESEPAGNLGASARGFKVHALTYWTQQR